MTASPENSLMLTNQTAVVTGAASGIGRAIATTFARAGANVVIHTRSNESGLQETADIIADAGGAAHQIYGDISNKDDCNAIISSAWAWQDRLDIWVNNAGADVLTTESATKSFEEKLDLLWHVDVLGTIRLSRAVGERMSAQGSGVIINMGWDQATQGMEGEPGELFGPTKGAIMAFTKSLAASLAPKVRVNCLAPGWIQTKWGDDTSQYWNDRAKAESLMNRWGSVDDVAAAALFLASPAATFQTAQVLQVNGGFRYQHRPRS